MSKIRCGSINVVALCKSRTMIGCTLVESHFLGEITLKGAALIELFLIGVYMG